jgi:ribosomal protein L17
MHDDHRTGQANSDDRRRRNRWKMRSRRGSPTSAALELLKPGASCVSVARRARLHRQTVEHLFAGEVGEVKTKTTLAVARALHVPVERLVTTIERCDAAKRRDAERNAAERAANATATDGQTRNATRARHLGPATITPKI